MRRVPQQTKLTSFYFYEGENKYTKSSGLSQSSTNKKTLNPLKYRSLKGDLKREIQLYGRILPRTMDAPILPDLSTTLATQSWSEDQESSSAEFFFLLNEKDYSA